MPEYIESGVRDLRGSTSDQRVTLIVGGYASLDELESELEEISPISMERIGSISLKIEIEEARVSQVCELESVASVEFDAEDVYPQSASGFPSRPGSMIWVVPGFRL